MFSDFGPTQAATLGGLVVALACIVFLRRSRWAKRNAGPAASAPEQFLHLQSGRRYQVVRAFVDYDGQTHPVGETWVYVRHNFVPYEDDLSLYVRGDDGAVRAIRMCWRGPDQGAIIDALADHVHELPA